MFTSCVNYDIYQNIEYNYAVKRYCVETIFGQPKYYVHYSYGAGCQLDSIRLIEHVKALRWQNHLRDSLAIIKSKP
jgi:hypothetical protein